VTGRSIAIVVAAGSGERLGATEPKAFVELDGVPLVVRAARSALACPSILSVVVAVPAGREARAEELLAEVGPHAVVAGGETRQASVRAALAVAADEAEVILVHDAARPFATPELFSAVHDAVAEADGAVPVVQPADTVKRVSDGWIGGTDAREGIGLAQTPQAFRAAALRESHERALGEARTFTDDAALLEWAGFRIRAVPGDPANFKVTTAEDLERARLVAQRVRG
jgi:2-C-methyl-D-erythritol 4-phosphate cytidylyltransferase